MSMHICQCCAGRMSAGSPRNPNICLSCEQLLEDDGAELERLMAGTEPPAADAELNGPAPEKPAEVVHEVFSSGI